MRFFIVSLVLAGLLLPLTHLPAQDADPQSIYARDSNQGVYVRDSGIAVEKLALAERMERLKEWHKAADVYQEILADFSDRVLPTQSDAENRIYQYASVAAVVQERLCKWPEEGLSVYRGLYEPRASSLLAAITGADREALSKIVALYFPTDSAKLAGIRLMDDYFENGDFPAVAWLGDRLLAIHPNLAVERPIVLYRTALAYQLSGYTTQAAARLDELKSKHPDAAGLVRGKDVSLSQTLEAELARAHAQSRPNPDSWPTAFGSDDRARIADAQAPVGGALLFGVELAKTSRPPANQPNVAAMRRPGAPSEESDRNRGLMTGILPVIDAGELFFNDNANIYGVSMDSGLPLSGWAATYGSEPNIGRYTTNLARTPRGVLSQTTVTRDAVYAVLGQADLPGNFGSGNPNLAGRGSILVCLDRETGRERWKLSPSQLAREELRQLHFAGSIVLTGESIIVPAHNRRQGQFEDSYLLCIDVNTRQVKWSTIIASSTPSTIYTDPEGGIGLAARSSQISYSGGRIYVLSNSGALAAVDAYNGQIVWLNIYPRDAATGEEQRFRRMGMPYGQSDVRPPWALNPPIVADGRIFILPADGRYIHIYDAGNGVEIKRIPTDYYNRDNKLNALIGVAGDKLIAENGDDIVCFNWPKFDANGDRFDNLHWAQSVKRQRGAEAVRGRALLTAKHVLAPTVDRLWAFALEGGAIVHAYPPTDRAWDDSEGPGNVLVSSTHLILATPGSVNVYTDLNLAKARLDAQITQAPEDASLRLRYAEVMFVAGVLDQTLVRLDEAIALAGGRELASTSPAGERIFTSAMTFAGKLIRQNKAEHRPIIVELFDRAASAASTPQQHVSYRLARSRFAHDAGDVAAQLRLLQQILQTPDWRGAPVSEGGGPSTQAALLAERAIAEIIRRNPELYAPFEDQANAGLNAARAAGNPGEMLDIALSFPNSKLAPQAMLSAADAFEAIQNPRQAVQVLRQLYFKYPDFGQRLTILESMIRNYLAMPNRFDAAAARIAQAIRIDAAARLSHPLTLPDGRVLENITFAELQTLVKQVLRSVDAQQLPLLNLPRLERGPDGKWPQAFLPEDRDNVVADFTQLLVPARRFSRPDRMVAVSRSAGVCIFAAGQTRPLYSVQIFSEPLRDAAWIGENLLLFSAQKIAMINGASGEVLWQAPLSDVPAIEIAAGPDAAAPADDVPQDLPVDGQVAPEIVFNQMRLGGANVIVRGGNVRIRGNIRVGARNVVEAVEVAAAAGPEQIEAIEILTDRLIASSSTGRIYCLDLGSGKLLWQNRPSDRAVDRLLASDDFVVAAMVDGNDIRFSIFDAVSGQFLSRRNANSPQGGLVNAALSSDGKLVYLLPDQLCVRDLYSAGDELAFWRGGQRGSGVPIFAGALTEEHLILSEGNIFVISNNGQFARIYSLETGEMILPGGKRTTDQANLGVPTQTSDSSPAGDWNARMLVLGTRFYLIGKRSLASYDLDREGAEWSYDLDKTDNRWTIREVIPARDYLLAVKFPAADEIQARAAARRANPPPNPRVRGAQVVLSAYSRAITPSGLESGNLEHEFTLTEPTGVSAYQVVNGGVYYQSGDNKLHYLQSAGK